MESVAYALNEDLVKIETVLKLFDYNPEQGTVTRKVSYGRAIAGQVFTQGRISVRGVLIGMNRLIWAIHNKMWPPKGYWVDHIDQDKSNNRISNLRLATPTQNQQNKAGYGMYAKGVTWRDRIDKPYQAKIRVNGTRIHLGSFATEAEASEAYQQACIKYHGEFACPK